MAKKMLSMILIYIFVSIVLLPALITYCSSQTHTQAPSESELAVTEIVRPSSGEFEDYIKGVVAAEMPALFQEEALKAQAVSARTYAVRKMEENGSLDVPYDIGQAYITTEEMKQKWGEHFTDYYNKISDAVDATKGEIMVYENQPILAVFHAQSSGKTESAENVWSQSLPYLQRVDSAVDEKAPDFEKTVAFTYDEIIKKFQQKYSDFQLPKESIAKQIHITSRSDAGYVQQIQMGNQTLTGREVREVLGLRSANFTVAVEGDILYFTTKGYGHGAGMSQYGAELMAQEGKTYHEILQHYYTGISFVAM